MKPDERNPVFKKRGSVWIPSPVASGPFTGQHGGAVAGVMAAALEYYAAEGDFGIGLKFALQLLRPVAVVPAKISVGVVRGGSRITVLRASMITEAKQCALAHAIFVQPKQINGLSDSDSVELSPEEGTPFEIGEYSSKPWFWDTIEGRRDNSGVFWLRPTRPVTDPLTPLALVASMADWSSGLSRPDSLTNPIVAAFPNADLSIHLSRLPVGRWIGVKPVSMWENNGMGLTDSQLFDIRGSLGRSCQTIVLVPIED